jgi:hypothetical protein
MGAYIQTKHSELSENSQLRLDTFKHSQTNMQVPCTPETSQGRGAILYPPARKFFIINHKKVLFSHLKTALERQIFLKI